jgi:hypothetical protein
MRTAWAGWLKNGLPVEMRLKIADDRYVCLICLHDFFSPGAFFLRGEYFRFRPVGLEERAG